MTDPKPDPAPHRTRTALLLRSAIAVDILMIVLLAINLGLLLFDAAFAGSAAIREGLRDASGGFYEAYRTGIHDNFALIDLAFVAVFLVEIIVRWIIAAKRRTHRRWYYYPLVNWYDVLGCVPIGSLRILRLLRVVTIVFRAHRMGVIDLRTWGIYRFLERYKRILVEEVSDRVVVQVLSGIQSEISGDSKVLERIWTEAIAPHKDALVTNIEAGAARLIEQTVTERQPANDAYVTRVVNEALRRSNHVFDSLAAVPFIGDNVVGQIKSGVTTIVHHVVAQLHEDARRLDVERLGAEVELTLTRAFAERGPDVEGIVRTVLMATIEILKDQVMVQQWKLRDEEEKAEEEAAAAAA